MDTQAEVRELAEWLRDVMPEDVAVAVAEDCGIAYTSEGRYYHDLRHCKEVVVDLLNVPGGTVELVLAGAYHDFIYDPTGPKGDNEQRSADFAAKRADSWGYDGDEVHRLIMLTVDHEPRPGDRIGQLMCDADLIRFAIEPYSAFVSQNEDIRREYAHVSDEDWARGRPAVLLKYLVRNPFYYTLANRHSDRATLNIVRALREMGWKPGA